MTSGARNGGSEPRCLLVASKRSWLVSSLESIVERAGLDLRQARTGEEVLRRSSRDDVAMVLVDHELGADADVAVDLCRDLVEGPLDPAVPLIFYTSSTFADTDLHTRALNAGAWTILREPLETDPLLALVRRLRTVSGLVTVSQAHDGLVDPETGLLTLTGLRRVLPSLGALAVRNQAPVTFVAVGPTSGDSTNGDLRTRTAEVCSGNVRGADVCAWMSGDDLVIVAYDTPAGGARQLVKRLNEATEALDDDSTTGSLSAGIVELRPREGLEEAVQATRPGRFGEDEVPATEFEDLFTLSVAREALEQARRAGGGVQVASVA